MADQFQVKDSGKRQQFESGMQRDTQDDKVLYELALDGPMFERLAIHLTKGAKKYTARNWMQARTEEERERFRSSAVRHFMQWLRGDTDEDHAAAVFFNINGVEYVQAQIKAKIEYDLAFPHESRMSARAFIRDQKAKDAVILEQMKLPLDVLPADPGTDWGTPCS